MCLKWTSQFWSMNLSALLQLEQRIALEKDASRTLLPVIDGRLDMLLSCSLRLPAIFTPSQYPWNTPAGFSLGWILVIFPLQTHHFFQRRRTTEML